MSNDSGRHSFAMPDRPVRGDMALALGALAAGVRVVTGYPGSPATGVFDGLLALTEPGELNIHWSPNEKVAMEEAFGASLAGSRALVVLKSVGMNVALDPLATLSLSGSHAGLVILLGDDPGGWSSQNEQDTRWLARTAEVPIVEPTGVDQAARVMAQAFAWSESLGTPVIVRITRALALASGVAEEPWQLPAAHKAFLRKRNRWIVLPYLVVRRHELVHARLSAFRGALEASPYDSRMGEGPLGVIAVGYAYTKLVETLGAPGEGLALLGLSSSWPLPDEGLIAWLGARERVLVLEEGGPFVEGQIRALAQRAGISVQILGRGTHSVPREGELSERDIAAAVSQLDPSFESGERPEESRAMPSTVPLCEDCPYLPAFEALIRSMERHGGREQYIIVGETGCMVRANLPPMELFDVKYNLGSGLAIGMGLAQADAKHHVVALVGDSSFFHSDIPAMPHVALHRPPMTIIALDNGTTALTGGQAHPGSAADEWGQAREQRADLVDVIAGCGVVPELHTPEDEAALEEAIDRALASRELSVLVVRGPCPRHVQES